jgi:hypothetical protein
VTLNERRGLGVIALAAAWSGPLGVLVGQAHAQQWPVPSGDPWTTWLLPWVLAAWTCVVAGLALAWLTAMPIPPGDRTARLSTGVRRALVAWGVACVAGLPFMVWMLRLGVGADRLVISGFGRAIVTVALSLLIGAAARAVSPVLPAFGAGLACAALSVWA